MKELARFKTEFSSYQFIATVFHKEKGLIIDITGPNDHLGGVGIGIPYIRKNGEKSANFNCISFPTHRDGELAGSIAQIISKVTRFHTVVIFGIHFPKLTKSQLKEIINFLERWSVDIGQQIISEISSNSNKLAG
ncbi:MAG: hypothetical protein ACFFAE_04165 [Candidatus Hodarchaeota archaeon]